MYLATENNGTGDGVKVVQKTFASSNEFKWTVTNLGGGYYKIINLNSGKSLDVESVSTANGANIQVWTYTGGLNQQWQFVQVESSTGKKTPIEEVKTALSEALIYVDASHDYLKVNNKNSGSGEIEVYSITGQLVIKKAVDFVEGSESQVEISRLSKGVYVVKVNDGKEVHSKKIVK